MMSYFSITIYSLPSKVWGGRAGLKIKINLNPCCQVLKHSCWAEISINHLDVWRNEKKSEWMCALISI